MAIRDLLLRLGGHDPATLKDHCREDRQPIVHLGWAVLIGAIVAGTNWAIAGYTFAGGHHSVAAFGSSFIACLIGFSLVVTIDRGGLYHMDTHIGRPIALWPLVAFRIAVTFFVSSITTQAVAPIFLNAELEEHALHVREQSDRDRARDLAVRFNLPGLHAAVARAEANAVSARQAVQTVPPDIHARLETVRACWANYARQRRQLLGQGLNEVEARRRVATIASRCSREDTSARQLLDEHGERTRAALAAAEEQLLSATRALGETDANVKARLVRASEIENSAITPLSSTVLETLLTRDAGAKRKFWTVYALIMALELMPLIAKLMGPQTVPGARIASDRLIALANHGRRRKAAADEVQVEEALRTAMASAMLDALSGSEVRNHAAQLFASKIGALVPIEVFKALMREIEARELDVQSAVRRYPQYARVITEAWRRTIDEVTERLRHMQAYPQPSPG